jgi:hypothetical protein
MEILRVIVEICGRILGLCFGYDEPIEKPSDLEEEDDEI